MDLIQAILKFFDGFSQNPIGSFLGLLAFMAAVGSIIILLRERSATKKESDRSSTQLIVAKGRAETELIAAKERADMTGRMLNMYEQRWTDLTDNQKTISTNLERLVSQMEKFISAEVGRANTVTETLQKSNASLDMFKSALEANTNNEISEIKALGRMIETNSSKVELIAGQHNTISGKLSNVQEVLARIEKHIFEENKIEIIPTGIVVPSPEPEKESTSSV